MSLIETFYDIRDYLVCWALSPLDHALDAYQSKRAPAALNPATNPQLQGNFAPVCESQGEYLVVTGKLPDDLSGAFVRNGPNPEHIPKGGYHWFDGDGMVHCVRIRNGAASYAGRYVATPRLAIDRVAGRAFTTRIGTLAGVLAPIRILLSSIKHILLWRHNASRRYDHANNTNIVYWKGRLLALVENSMPAWVSLPKRSASTAATTSTATNASSTTTTAASSSSSSAPLWQDAAIRTIAPWFDWSGAVRGTFTAHPKVCPTSGAMYSFGYTLRGAAHLYVHTFTPSGAVRTSFAVPGTSPSMVHDMSLTASSIIVQDQPLILDPFTATTVPNGVPLHFIRGRPMRFGVCPRDATSPDAVRWVEGPSGFSFHTGPAWDADTPTDNEPKNIPPTIVLTICIMRDFCFHTVGDPHDPAAPPRPLSEPYLYQLEVNTATAAVTRCRKVCSVAGEFPTWNQTVAGRVRYVYLAVAGEYQWPTLGGVVKVDLLAAAGAAVGGGGGGAAAAPAGGTGAAPLARSAVVAGSGAASTRAGAGGGVGTSPATPPQPRAAHAPSACDMDTEGAAAAPCASISFGEGKQGGECVFVPRVGAVSEDDGYLLTFVYDVHTNTSQFVVYDAKTFSETPLATVALPQRVPFGFHGNWVSDAELEQQLE